MGILRSKVGRPEPFMQGVCSIVGLLDPCLSEFCFSWERQSICMLSGTCASLVLGCATTTLSSGERFLLGEEAEVVMPSSIFDLISFRKIL